MLLAVLSLLVFVPLTERMLDSSRDEHMGLEGKDDRKLTWFGNKVNLLWIFAFGSLGALVAEGAAADWSGILLSEHMGVEKGLTASVFASFSLSTVSYTHLRAHETDSYLVCRLLLEKNR